MPVSVEYNSTDLNLSDFSLESPNVPYGESGTVNLGTVQVPDLPTGAIADVSIDFDNDSDIMVEVDVKFSPVFDF